MASKVNDNRIGEKLKEARKRAERTQQWCASLLGVSLSTYKRYENGLSKPTISQVSTLAEALGVTVESLAHEPEVVLLGALFSREEALSFKAACTECGCTTEELIHDIVKAIADGEILVELKDGREVVDHEGIQM